MINLQRLRALFACFGFVLLMAAFAPATAGAQLPPPPPTTQAECLAAGGQWKLADPETNTFACATTNTNSTGTGSGGTGQQTINPQANEFVINPAGDGDCKANGSCIVRDIQLLLNVLAVGVGVVVTLMIVISGFQYALSRDNPNAVAAAKGHIINAVIALIAFMFAYAFLEYLIPGGIFHP